MRFRWSDQSIQWFLNASEYTQFHKKLSKKLLPFLSKHDRVCDYGCGLGRLDIALAPHVSFIKALDINPIVIDHLSQDVLNLGLQNISSLCVDSKEHTESCDVGIMSFFGIGEKEMLLYRGHCKKKLIRIVNMKNQSTLYPHEYRKTRKDTVAIIKNELENSAISYQFIEIYLEFGQPFRSMNDAMHFVQFHAPDAVKTEIESFLSKYIIEISHERYSFYLPNKKHLGIFVLDC